MSENINTNYDVVIVGAGAAGLTAAIYTARKALSTLVVSTNTGGQASLTNFIENYPGLPEIDGFTLMEKMKSQAQKFGAEFKTETIKAIATQTIDGKELFVLKTPTADIRARSVIIASGLKHRLLNIPGEKEYTGKGVAYCATCDGPLFKNKVVAVVGCGNSALGAAQYLSHLAQKIYLINRGDKMSADRIIVERAEKNENITIYNNTHILAISGEATVKSITINKNEVEEKINLEGVFIEIGYEPDTDWLKDVADLNEKGEIVITNINETSRAGVFAAGDVTSIAYKQMIVAAGEGAKAALSAYNYLQRN